MIIVKYLLKKIFFSLFLSLVISISIFFIFSMMGNLGENFSFNKILYLSYLNSIQIFIYMPGYLFIFTIILFIIFLKSKNELVIIKEYIKIEYLILILVPLIIIFSILELNKNLILNKIDNLKQNLVVLQSFDNLKLSIIQKADKKIFTLIKNNNDNYINEYSYFEVEDNIINSAKFSNNLQIKGDKLISNSTTIYKENHISKNTEKLELIKNLQSILSNVERIKIIDLDKNKIFIINNLIILVFYIFFYLCITSIFFSKKLIDRNFNFLKIIFLVIILFIYYIFTPRIEINLNNNLFHFISCLVLLSIFFKIHKYE